MEKDLLYERITKKDSKICVIGLGQVGLPTALSFCKAGFDVTGYDINKNLLSIINSQKSPFEEDGLDDLLKTCMTKEKFHTTSSIDLAVPNSDVIIICVATPLTDDIKPDLSALENICISLSKFSLSGKLVIIESSIPPGTFAGLALPLLGNKKTGEDFWAAFVPERFAPGKGLAEIQTIPRLIGCLEGDSGFLAKALYQNIVNSDIFLTAVEIAELSKLVENTFRDVNVAFANEVGLICEKYGIDVAELIKACNSHPRVKLLQPGPGVGGPCLTKDPYLLLSPQGSRQIESKIILDSRKINDNMPYHVVRLVTDALKSQDKHPAISTILVFGTAYKANVSDTRSSPAKQIISQLVKDGYKVLVFDPNTKDSFGGQVVTDIWDAISISDALIVVTDHDEFKKLDLKEIGKLMKKKPILVDTRRIFQRKEAEELGINYFAVGYTKNLR